jgi:hypothetical protein
MADFFLRFRTTFSLLKEQGPSIFVCDLLQVNTILVDRIAIQ